VLYYVVPFGQKLTYELFFKDLVRAEVESVLQEKAKEDP